MIRLWLHPTEQLEQMGIEVRYQLGDMVVMNIPADKLLQLENVGGNNKFYKFVE